MKKSRSVDGSPSVSGQKRQEERKEWEERLRYRAIVRDPGAPRAFSRSRRSSPSRNDETSNVSAPKEDFPVSDQALARYRDDGEAGEVMRKCVCVHVRQLGAGAARWTRRTRSDTEEK